MFELTFADVPASSHDAHRLAIDWLVRLGGIPVTYADASSFAVTQSGACKCALSFDRDFVAAGFALWRA